jgi:type IV pilus assembly protein PilB
MQQTFAVPQNESAAPSPQAASPHQNFAVSALVCGYSPIATRPIIQLIERVQSKTPVRLMQAGFSDLPAATHDMAFAVYDGKMPIGQFVSDCARLKFTHAIQQVFAVATEDGRELLMHHRAEIVADDVIYLPVDLAEFARLFASRVTAIYAARQPVGRSTKNPAAKARPLGDLLVSHRVISGGQLKQALDFQKGTRLKLGEILIELGFINEEQRLHFLSSQQGVEVVTPRQYALADHNVVALIPEHVARRHTCCAVERRDRELLVVMTDVQDLRLLDKLRDITELTIRPLLGSAVDILAAIDRFYHTINSHKDATTLIADLGDRIEFVQENAAEIDVDTTAAEGAEQGIVKLVNLLVANAVVDHASDIHIEPQAAELIVRYRIDGELRRVMSPPRQSHQAIITRLKILSNLDIAERRVPQDGRMSVRIENREVDIRVSILPSVFGEKAVLRILDKKNSVGDVSGLGFTPHDEQVFRSQIAKPYGIILVTGPTGSGKSTTLYAALQAIRDPSKNIVTVEDPVEYHIREITQVQVNTKAGLTFGTALRSILRQDPDVVLIGEIRDQETADIAIKMSLTGHLVLSTLHTNDAAGAIARLTDIGVPPLLLGSSLNLILAQRLVRKICPRCRKEYTPPPEMIEQLNLHDVAQPRFYHGVGCIDCNGVGYAGRTAIVEMMPVSRNLRTLILRSAPTSDLQTLAEQEGMQSLRQAGIQLALAGITTIEQVIAATIEV